MKTVSLLTLVVLLSTISGIVTIVILYTHNTNVQQHLDFVPAEFGDYQTLAHITPLFRPQHAHVNVVMGLAEGAKRDPKGYGTKGLTKFVQSLVDTGFQGYVMLATDNFDNVDRDLNDRFKNLKHVNVFLFNASKFRVGFLKDIHSKELRYYLYNQWAQYFTNPKTRIFITDVRDVYFQQNPFNESYLEDAESGMDLYLFGEPMTIAGSSFNSQWIRNCFGRDVYENVSNGTVICSGTTMGSPRGIEVYSKQMIDAMAAPERKNCRKPIHDQSFHNVLFYTGQLSSRTHVFAQGHGPANSIAKTPLYTPFFENGIVLNEDGRPSALVHQYDRHPQIRNVVRAYIRNLKL